MGANQSSNNEKINDPNTNQPSLKKTIDYLAANYILTNSFQNLKKLGEKDQCKEMVLLTSNIVNEYLTTREIDFLKQRIEGTNTENPVEINKMTKEDIMYYEKEDIPKLDVSKPLRRKRICIGIAKYYVEIYNLFNAIVHTINPIYTWKDSTGQIVSVGYEMKKDIPSNIQPTITRNNLCSNRINSALNNTGILGENITIDTSKIPSISNTTQNNGMYGPVKNLQEEIGIPELEKLYYDDYNYSVGKFTQMTPKMNSEIYQKDVQLLYNLFHGGDMPETIKTFSDINLIPFKEISIMPKIITGSLKEELFSNYVVAWQTMKRNTQENQDKLLKILEEIFTTILDPDDSTQKKTIVIIRKDLTNDKLQGLISETRNLIINLYGTCEKNYQEILKILQAIIANQEKETSLLRISEMEKQKDMLLSKQSLLTTEIQSLDSEIDKIKNM